MNVAHPYRYPIAFRRQFDRLESLVPGITDRTIDAGASDAFLERELNGTAPEELAKQSQRLWHLERLLADWVAEGETTYQSQVNTDGTDDLTMGAADAPSCVSYIAFESDPQLELNSLEGGRVEGVYIREIEFDRKPSVEFTFVCYEHGWSNMQDCFFADAVKVGARIGIGVIPLDEEITVAQAAESFKCDPVLREARAFEVALASAVHFATDRFWRTFGR